MSDTRFEKVEDILRVSGLHAVAEGGKRAVPDTAGFRPIVRPPMLLLGILDDGGEDGEWIRIRGDGLVIGRDQGDVRIPHDTMISGRHAELSRQTVRGAFR